MNKRADRFIFSLLVIAILVVAANAWLAFHAENVLTQDEYWVVHTWQVIDTVNRTLDSVELMEAGARGYLLSEDGAYLDSYRQGFDTAPRELNQLAQLTADNPRQMLHVAALRGAVEERIRMLAVQVRLEQAGQHTAALATMRQDTGREQMRQVRGVVAAMQAEEGRLLLVRDRQSAAAHRETRFALSVASGGDLLLLLLALWWLARERRLREQARLSAQRLARLQSIIDAGLSHLDVTELRSEMLHRLCAVAGASAAAIYSYHPRGTAVDPSLPPEPHIVAEASDGADLPTGTIIRVEPGSPLERASGSASVIKLSGPAVLELPIPEFNHAMGTLLLLPLRASDRTIGIIILGNKRENAFTADDEDLLGVAADRIALSIDRARLFARETLARQSAEASAAEVRILNAELEQRVRQRTLELETTNRELEAFAYSVSHDLRAPLRSVDGFSVALAEDFGELLQGEGRYYLSRIRAGVQRMGGLIDALLQLSRITRADISPEDVDLSALAGAVADDLKQAHAGRPIEFEIEPNLHAECDSHLMNVVFENMFGNAVKFTSRVDQPRIAFGWSPLEQAYYIRDNGAGFDQRYVGKLFVAFQRLHGDKDFQGSGIGLATVARVIHRHHGTIRAEGVVGQGATFWFTLR